MQSSLITVIILALSLFSCSKNEPIYQPTEKNNPYTLYQEGYVAFEKNDFFLLIRNF